MQVSKIRKTFANVSTTNINFLRNQLSEMVQLFDFLDKLFRTLIKTGFSLMGNVLKPLAKNVWVLLGLTAAASATDTTIQKNIFGSGTTLLIFSNKELNDIIKFLSLLKVPVY